MTNKENKILIITGGQVEDSFLSARVRQEQYSMMIAADSGLAAADRLNLPLDFIVGDFDSVSEEVLKKYKELSTPIETFPREKDKTDTQIAIELALEHKATSLEIIGATGSRLDHVLANIHLLLLPLQLQVDAFIVDRNNKIYLKKESFVLQKDKQFGNYVSLLPFSEKVRDLSLKGFKYPLNKVVLTTGNSLGISNEILEVEASVEFTEGILLVIESRD
jgi:thiamine pyrophosphokinase